MKTQLITPFAIAMLSLLQSSEISAKQISILVNAKASDVYQTVSDKLEHQTYHFYRGKFFGGSTRDEGLEQLDFEAITDSLSEALKRRNLYPESEKKLGDLLIMVSWGRTSPDPDIRGLMAIDSFEDTLSAAEKLRREKEASEMGKPKGSDESGSNFDPMSGIDEQQKKMVESHTALSGAAELMLKRNGFAKNKALNIALLGIEDELKWTERASFRGERGPYWDLIEEERYFVILNAFDYQLMLQHGEVKQLWSLRYNTRATGVGFPDALDAMNKAVVSVAGMNFGRMFRLGGTTSGSGEFGEVEVIDMDGTDEDVVEAQDNKSRERKKR